MNTILKKICRKVYKIFVQAIVMLCIVPVDQKDIPEKKDRSFAWEKICGKVLRGKVLVGGKSGKNEW